MVDRREHERVLHQLRLTIDDGQVSFGGWSVDLSEGGLRLVSDRELLLNSRLKLRIHLPQGSLSLPIRVLRVTSADGQSAYGVRFIRPSPHARSVIRATIAEAAMRHALGRVAHAPRPREESHIRLRVDDAPPISTDGRVEDDTETTG